MLVVHFNSVLNTLSHYDDPSPLCLRAALLIAIKTSTPESFLIKSITEQFTRVTHHSFHIWTHGSTATSFSSLLAQTQLKMSLYSFQFALMVMQHYFAAP